VEVDDQIFVIIKNMGALNEIKKDPSVGEGNYFQLFGMLWLGKQ